MIVEIILDDNVKMCVYEDVQGFVFVSSVGLSAPYTSALQTVPCLNNSYTPHFFLSTKLALSAKD